MYKLIVAYFGKIHNEKFSVLKNGSGTEIRGYFYNRFMAYDSADRCYTNPITEKRRKKL